jgi:hypothetical protein
MKLSELLESLKVTKGIPGHKPNKKWQKYDLALRTSEALMLKADKAAKALVKNMMTKSDKFEIEHFSTYKSGWYLDNKTRDKFSAFIKDVSPDAALVNNYKKLSTTAINSYTKLKTDLYSEWTKNDPDVKKMSATLMPKFDLARKLISKMA